MKKFLILPIAALMLAACEQAPDTADYIDRKGYCYGVQRFLEKNIGENSWTSKKEKRIAWQQAFANGCLKWEFPPDEQWKKGNWKGNWRD